MKQNIILVKGKNVDTVGLSIARKEHPEAKVFFNDLGRKAVSTIQNSMNERFPFIYWNKLKVPKKLQDNFPDSVGKLEEKKQESLSKYNIVATIDESSEKPVKPNSIRNWKNEPVTPKEGDDLELCGNEIFYKVLKVNKASLVIQRYDESDWDGRVLNSFNQYKTRTVRMHKGGQYFINGDKLIYTSPLFA